MALTESEKRRVVSMYKDGKRTAEITAALGISRTAMYDTLAAAGVVPNRQGRGRLAPSGSELSPNEYKVTLDWALERIANLERDNGRLRERMRIALKTLDTE